MDTTSIKRPRAGIAKVNMQIDLTRPRTRLLWVGLYNDVDTIVVWLLVEYENIPPYCEYCRHQCHDVE